jgi:rhodanese-related sulfurtransferase
MIKLGDLNLAALVLLISTICGAGANLIRPKPLSWIREPDAPPMVTTASAPAGMSADFVLDHLTNRTAFFIDARAHHEYVEGHLSGAISLPSDVIYKEINRILDVVPVVGKVIVYCGGGQCEASHNVANALRRDFGFTDVAIYENGWEEVFTSARFKQHIAAGEDP